MPDALDHAKGLEAQIVELKAENAARSSNVAVKSGKAGTSGLTAPCQNESSETRPAVSTLQDRVTAGGEGPQIDHRVAVLLPTLIANGFVPQHVHRRPTYLEVGCSRIDEFGARIPYLIALAESTLGEAEMANLTRAAQHRHAQLVVIGSPSGDAIAVPWDTFVARLGGPVKVWAPLEPEAWKQKYRDSSTANDARYWTALHAVIFELDRCAQPHSPRITAALMIAREALT